MENSIMPGDELPTVLVSISDYSRPYPTDEVSTSASHKKQLTHGFISTPNETQRRVIILRGDSNPQYVETRFPLKVYDADQIFSEYNTQTIEDNISQTQPHLDLLNENLEHLGALQREYESARTHIMRYINLHKSALAPIRRLPREILARIFLECKDAIKILREDAPVWKLCRVSRSWRQLAIALPALWSNISLRNFRWSSYQQMGSSTLELCLSRSSSYPLTLDIYVDRFIPLDQLLRVSDRWENIKISWNKYCHSQPASILSSICGQLPKLRRLMFSILESDPSGGLQLFSDAPKLTHLEFFGNDDQDGRWRWGELLRDKPLASKFPWDQITHLTLRARLPFSVYMTFMNLLSRLDTLIAPDIVLDHNEWAEIHDDDPPADILLYDTQLVWQPGLQTLLINGNMANYSLHALATPHLSKLCLEMHEGPPTRIKLAAQSLSAHFSKYGCPLQTLYIADHLDAVFLNTLFAGTPTVETLYLLPHNCADTCDDLSGFEATFHALTYTFETHNTTLLPNLQDLYLGEMPSTLGNIGSVLELIRSRNDVAPQIAAREKIPLACVPIRTFKLLNEVQKYPEGVTGEIRRPKDYRVYPSLLDWETPSGWSSEGCSW